MDLILGIEQKSCKPVVPSTCNTAESGAFVNPNTVIYEITKFHELQWIYICIYYYKNVEYSNLQFEQRVWLSPGVCPSNMQYQKHATLPTRVCPLTLQHLPFMNYIYFTYNLTNSIIFWTNLLLLLCLPSMIIFPFPCIKFCILI